MLFVTNRVALALGAAFARAWPSEACGLLLGPQPAPRVLATEVILPRGAAASQGAFELADYELRRVQAWGEDRGLEIVALFHSHPSGDARLSAADRASLAHSRWPWVIVTRGPGRVAPALTGYRPGEARPMQIRIEPEGPQRSAVKTKSRRADGEKAS